MPCARRAEPAGPRRLQTAMHPPYPALATPTTNSPASRCSQLRIAPGFTGRGAPSKTLIRAAPAPAPAAAHLHCDARPWAAAGLQLFAEPQHPEGGGGDAVVRPRRQVQEVHPGGGGGGGGSSGC
jgi:hypothetical protein